MGLAAGMLRKLIKRLFTGASIRLSGKATEEPDKTTPPPGSHSWRCWRVARKSLPERPQKAKC